MHCLATGKLENQSFLSTASRQRYTLLLYPISLSLYTPCCYCPSLSVHPVVTVPFPLSLCTLLLLCPSLYLCTPCCYCALPSISVHPVVTVPFPLSLCTLLLLCPSLYLCAPCCYCALPYTYVHPPCCYSTPLSTPCCYFSLQCHLPCTLPNTPHQTHLLALHFTVSRAQKSESRTILHSITCCFNICTTRNAITLNISTLAITTVTLKHHFEVRCSFVYMRSEEFGRRFGSCRCRVTTGRKEMKWKVPWRKSEVERTCYAVSVLNQPLRHETIRSGAATPSFVLKSSALYRN